MQADFVYISTTFGFKPKAGSGALFGSVIEGEIGRMEDESGYLDLAVFSE